MRVENDAVELTGALMIKEDSIPGQEVVSRLQNVCFSKPT